MDSSAQQKLDLPKDFMFDGQHEIDDIRFAAQFAQLEAGCSRDVQEEGKNLSEVDMLRKAALLSGAYDLPDEMLDHECESDDEQNDTSDYMKQILKQENLELMDDDEDICGNNPLLQMNTERITIAQEKENLVKKEKENGSEALVTTGVPSEDNKLAVKNQEERTNCMMETDHIATHAADNETITEARIGTITTHLDGLLIVKGTQNTRALDLRSVLCLNDGQVVGVICDVFGNIQNPQYLLYPSSPPFNQDSEATKKAFPIGSDVYAIEQQASYAIDFDPQTYSQGQANMKFHTPLEDGSSDSEVEMLEN